MTSPDTTMRVVEARGFSIDKLALASHPVPAVRQGEILIRVAAASLNYRDLAVLSGTYMPDLALPYIPASDACGRVEAVGEDVTRFSVGDRVVPCYIQGWHDGALTPHQRFNRTLGGPLPGVLRDYVVVPAEDAVHAPAHLSDAEAATLPIAAVTAWSCLRAGSIKTGDTVLVQGTGGVSLFALQFAKAAGARVIALTSTDAKAQRLRELGADAVVNYRETPKWADAVRSATNGAGVDIVVETTGSSLGQSLSAVAFGGFIGVVGFVGGLEAPLNVRQLIGPMVRMQGIVVGSRVHLEQLSKAMAAHGIRPVVDPGSFALEDSAEAFRHMTNAAHVGKIVIRM